MKNKSNSFIKSVSIVMIIALIGKFLGLVKQIIIASYFGASEKTDLFFVSYSFIYGIAIAFFSSLSIVFLPMYAKSKKQGKEQANVLFSQVLAVFIPVAIAIILFIVFFSDFFSNLLISGYTTDLKIQLSKYILYLSPIILIYCISSIFNTVSEYNKNFIPNKLLTPLFNFCVILFTVLFSKKFGINAVVFSVLVAYGIHIIISFIAVKKQVDFKIVNPFREKKITKLFIMLLPLIFGNAIVEINTMVDRSVASNLGIGIISAVTYAASINEIITSLVISNFASIFYTYITSLITENEEVKIKNYIVKIIKSLSLVLIPITIILIVNANSIVTILYNRGNFTTNDVINSSAVIIGYAFGFIPTMISNLLIKVHYAYGDTKSPMFNGIISVLVNIVLSIAISRKFGVIGISLSTSISALLSSVLSYFTVKKHINIKFNKKSIIWILKLFLAGSISAVLCVLTKNIMTFSIIINVVIISILTLIIYILLLKLLGFTEISELYQIFIKKIKSLTKNTKALKHVRDSK